MLVPFVKLANRLFDLLISFFGLFGLKILPETRKYYYQGLCFAEGQNGNVGQIPDFEVHDGDIFVATYPRSGTHYTAELIDCILDDGDTTRLRKVHQNFRSPFIELGHPCTVIPVLNLLFSLFGIIQRAQRDLSGFYKSRKPPRVFKTHLPVQLIPKQVLTGKGKLVYVARNPLDTMLSYWKLFNSLGIRLPDSFDKYHEAFLSGDVYYGSWFDHVTSYWKIRENENILFLKFEDMKADTRGAIRQVAEFLERGSLSDETVEKIANHCSLENMKANEMTSLDVLFPSSIMDKSTESGFINKGAVGNWCNEMTREQAERIKQKYREKVASQGLIIESMNY